MAATHIPLIGAHPEWFGKTVSAVELNSPKAGLMIQLGEPRALSGNRDATFWIERDDVIAAYLDRLLAIDGKPVDGGAGHFLSQLDLVDGMQIKDALFGFFTAAQARIFAARAMSSSSTSASSGSPRPTT